MGQPVLQLYTRIRVSCLWKWAPIDDHIQPYLRKAKIRNLKLFMDRPTHYPRLILQMICGACLLGLPSLSLLYGSAPGIIFHTLALVGLINIAVLAWTQSGRMHISAAWSRTWFVFISFVIPLLVSIISHLLSADMHGALPSVLQRLAMTAFVAAGLAPAVRKLNLTFQLGVVLGTIAACIILYKISNGGQIRPDPDAQNLLNYTNYITILAVWSLCLLRWPVTQYRKTELVIKLISFLCAAYAISLSASRGPLLTLAVLTAIYFLFLLKQRRFVERLALLVAVFIVGGAISLQSADLRSRLSSAADAASDYTVALVSGKPATHVESSTGIRVEQWHASWLMFKEHPWFGDGSREFAEKLIALNRRGLVSDRATWKEDGGEAFVQPHNETANALGNYGLAGVFTLLLLYLAPACYFIRRKRQADGRVSVICDMGILTSISTALFGLTVTVFTSNWMVAIYAVSISTLVALCEAGRASRPADRAIP